MLSAGRSRMALDGAIDTIVRGQKNIRWQLLPSNQRCVTFIQGVQGDCLFLGCSGWTRVLLVYSEGQ